ncbi:11023_t:CDS:2, partial [Funneliformis geosporum]
CENIGGDHVKRGDAYAEIEVSLQFLSIRDKNIHAVYRNRRCYCSIYKITELDVRICTFSTRIPAKHEAALLRINETHSQGLEYHAKRLKAMIDNYSLDFWNDITYLLRKNHDVEVLFSNSDKREEAVHALRDEYKNDLDKVVFIVLSHSKVEAKDNLILHNLDQ